MKPTFIFAFIFGLSLTANAGQIRVNNASEAEDMCNGRYSCNGETIAQDNRPPLPVVQPVSPQTVQGLCGPIPRGRDYMARATSIECGGGDDVRLRERLPHTQEELDKNFELLGIGKTLEARTAAQEALLKKDYGWTSIVKFNVKQNWNYQTRVGDYVNCSGRPGAEGGGFETYQTTCYRSGRKEKVVQRYVRKTTYCAVANPPPAPAVKDDDDDDDSGASGIGTIGTSGGGSGGEKKKEKKPTEVDSRKPTQPKGEGESSGEIIDAVKKRREKRNQGSLELNEILRVGPRTPAQYYRRISEDSDTSRDSEPAYGCQTWRTRTDVDEDRYVWVDAPDLEYSCVKTRNQWCTWLETRSDSAACPEQKTATLNVKYKTPSDWNPNNPKYDDQLPNKFDLLLGEGEYVRVGVNASGKMSNEMVPSQSIANALPGREKPWNQYETRWIPQRASCRYEDMSFDLQVTPITRELQPAPNPLMIPENPFDGVDEKGRPKNLVILNPTRNLVLDRSNLSRVFGVDADATAKMTKAEVKVDPSLKNSGITRKFWENTRFWMRLIWVDGNKKIKISLFRKFNINQAGAIGDQLNISLAAENGMEKFYKMHVPFEKWFGFLGGDVSLDPKKNYEIEIKVAQPGFDGIYLSGLNSDASLSDEEKQIMNDGAYSESKYVPLGKVETKRTLMQRFWDWRARRMLRPGAETK